MVNLWAAEWNSRNKLDGVSRHIIYDKCLPKLFRTRESCRIWIDRNYGYIRDRKDLRAEPHGWRIPNAVKVRVIKASRLTGEG